MGAWLMNLDFAATGTPDPVVALPPLGEVTNRETIQGGESAAIHVWTREEE